MEILSCLSTKDLVLASQSPRRKQLLEEICIHFRTVFYHTEEIFPENLNAIETAVFLSEQKAKGFPKAQMKKNTIVITADTVVSIDNQLLGKPKDQLEAKEMLHLLSGKCHQVTSAFTLRSLEKISSKYAVTNVYFKNLSEQEIDYYVNLYKPLDKAGAYGIQEWIGKIGVEKIEGSYFNVMGLPIHLLYSELCTFETK